MLENRAIRYLAHPRALLESEHSRSRPLPYLTFAISYAWAGFSLSALRAWSLLVHAASALLVALLYLRWRGSAAGALLAAAVFLLHPLAADSVIYLSARGSVLVLFFLLLALWAHGRERQGPLTVALFWACAALAFLSRETAAALLPLLLLSHRLAGRPARGLLPYVAPLVAGALVVAWFKLGYLGAAWQGIFTVQGDVELSSPPEVLRLSLGLWPRIVLLFVAPNLLSLDHQIALPASWLSPAVLLGALLWACFLYALVRAWRSRSAAWAVPAWAFLPLLITNSVFPLFDPFAERHFYIALPAFAWGVALLADWRPRLATPALACLVAAAAVLFTLPRARLWQSPTALWLDAHAKAPEKFRPAFNAALGLLEEGDDKGTLRVLGETLARLEPGALTWEQQELGLGTVAAALVAAARARAETPAAVASALPAGFWRELALLKATGGKGSAAWEKEWSAARARVGEPALSPRARDPRWVAHSFALERAAALAAGGRTREAAAAYEAVLLGYTDRHIPYWTARESLADLYLALGREKEAVAQLELAAFQYKVFKRFPLQLQRKLYELHLKHGDLPRATDAIGELVRVYTDNVELRRLYADLLTAKKDRHAVRQAGEALYYERHAIGPDDEREIVSP